MTEAQQDAEARFYALLTVSTAMLKAMRADGLADDAPEVQAMARIVSIATAAVAVFSDQRVEEILRGTGTGEPKGIFG